MPMKFLALVLWTTFTLITFTSFLGFWSLPQWLEEGRISVMYFTLAFMATSISSSSAKILSKINLFSQSRRREPNMIILKKKMMVSAGYLALWVPMLLTLALFRLSDLSSFDAVLPLIYFHCSFLDVGPSVLIQVLGLCSLTYTSMLVKERTGNTRKEKIANMLMSISLVLPVGCRMVIYLVPLIQMALYPTNIYLNQGTTIPTALMLCDRSANFQYLKLEWWNYIISLGLYLLYYIVLFLPQGLSKTVEMPKEEGTKSYRVHDIAGHFAMVWNFVGHPFILQYLGGLRDEARTPSFSIPENVVLLFIIFLDQSGCDPVTSDILEEVKRKEEEDEENIFFEKKCLEKEKIEEDGVRFHV